MQLKELIDFKIENASTESLMTWCRSVYKLVENSTELDERDKDFIKDNLEDIEFHGLNEISHKHFYAIRAILTELQNETESDTQ